MKKYILLLCLNAMLVACDSSMKDAQQFAVELSSAIASGDTATLSRIFPDAAKADSLVLNCIFDSLQVDANAAGDTMQIRFSTDVFVTAVKNINGKFRVVSSHGLFAYPNNLLKLAKGTGWYDLNLDDIQNMERMADTTFVKYLIDKVATDIVAVMKENVKITKSTANGPDWGPFIFNIVVSNTGKRDIEASEYSITAKRYVWVPLSSMIDGSEEYMGAKFFPGKPIKADSSVTYTWTEKEDELYGANAKVQSSINFTPQLETLIGDYSPRGNEYAEYLSSKITK